MAQLTEVQQKRLEKLDGMGIPHLRFIAFEILEDEKYGPSVHLLTKLNDGTSFYQSVCSRDAFHGKQEDQVVDETIRFIGHRLQLAENSLNAHLLRFTNHTGEYEHSGYGRMVWSDAAASERAEGKF